ncbi:hypothetical protein CsatB_013845 [Cannabis sativa]
MVVWFEMVEGRFGWDCVARDCHGNIVEAFNQGHVGRVQPEVAEMVDIKEALSWIDRHNWGQVILESNSLVCVQAIQSKV